MGTTTTDYYLDGGNVVGEKTGTGITTYLRGSSLISETSGSTTQYYLHNAHGDVVNLTNTSGNSTKTYSYDAFGNEKNQVASEANPFRYCGEYLDKETNEYYLRARYYDPSMGRFINAWVAVAITGATGNMVSQFISAEINDTDDVTSALLAGAAAGINGKGAAELLSAGFKTDFQSITKAEQKVLLGRLGQITNRELTAIRQALSKNITPVQLNELIEKYGYDVLVSAFVSSSSTELIKEELQDIFQGINLSGS